MCTSIIGSTPPYSPATRSVPQPQEILEKKRWWAGHLPRSDADYPSPQSPMSDFSPHGRAASGGVDESYDTNPRREVIGDEGSSTYQSSTTVGLQSYDNQIRSHHNRPTTDSIPRSEPYGQLNSKPPAGLVGSAPTTTPPASLRSGEKELKPSRRSKAHVPAACGNCKKAHLACDIQRPCTRCVMTGKQATCRNVEHKKRGRPRLRDEREPKIEPPEGMVPPLGLPHAPIMPAPAPDALSMGDHRRMEMYRVLRSHGADSLDRDPITGRSPSAYPDIGGRDLRPVAFLNLNLTILRANRIFQDLFGLITDGNGPKLGEFLDPRHVPSLQRLETDLRQERSQKDENYLPPISGTADLEAAQRLPDSEIDRACTGFQIRSYQWSFVFPNGQLTTLQATVRLAKTTAFFAVIALPALPRPGPRPTIPFTQHSTPSCSSPTSLQQFNFSPRQQPAGPFAPPLPPSPLSTFQNLNTSLPPSSPNIYTHAMPPPLARSLHSYPSYQPPASQSSGTYRPSSHTPEPIIRRESLQLPPIMSQGQSPPPMPSARFAVSSFGRDNVGYPYPDNEDGPDWDSRKRRRIYE